MRIRPGIRRAFQLVLRRRDRWEREVDDEIRLHLTLRAEQLVAEGRTPDQAVREAKDRFGPLDESRARLFEAARHREARMERTEYIADLKQDLAFAIRTLGRQKAWTIVTILTLALGIGATTAVFSVVSNLLLHPLPFPNADRVVYITREPKVGNALGALPLPADAMTVRAWIKASHAVEAFEGTYVSWPRLAMTSGDPLQVNVQAVFPTFMTFAGVRPVIGRMFTQNDIDDGGGVVLLDESFWRARLAGDRAVLGRVLTIGESSYRVIGVMPAAVGGRPSGNNIQFYKPLDVRDDGQAMELMARLRKGATIAGAAAELDSIFARNEGITDGMLPFTTKITAPSDALAFKDSLILLFAAVALVLLVACANVAHLLLARGTARRRELAIRAALGAGRGRILRQLLAESLLLTVAGTVSGVFLGWVGLRAMVGMRPQSLDSLATAHLDATTVFGAIAVALVSGLVFGVVGALHSRRSSTHDALKAASPSIGRRNERARGLLVVSEMALSAVLLVGATLLIRSVINLQRADLGFDAHGLYAYHLDLRANQIRDEVSRAAVLNVALPRLRALPGVIGVSIARAAPGFRPLSIGRLEIEGEPMPPADATSWIEINSVDRAYLSTMRMTLREGAGFVDTSAIGSGSPLMTSREVIVNASFARKHWQGSAVGHRLRMPRRSTAAPAPWLTIVGVVNDAQTTGPMADMTSPMLYVPRHDYSEAAVILVRTSGGATSLAPGTALLKELGLRRIEPPESIGDTMARSIALPRFVMALLGVFTGFALVLAAIGLYGVMAYSVAERTREIGIRVALGATGTRIAQNVIGSGALLAALGATVGMGAAAWGTRLIESQLFGLTRLDPQSFAIGIAVLFGVALLACIVPTRRALAVDPLTAIRAE